MSAERLLERISELEESHKDEQIKAIRAKVPAERMGPEICECGETIHIDRRMMGFKDCFYCANEREIKSKQYARHQ